MLTTDKTEVAPKVKLNLKLVKIFRIFGRFGLLSREYGIQFWLPKAVLAGTSPPFSVLISQNATQEQNTIKVKGV